MTRGKKISMALILWLLGFGFSFLQWRLSIPSGLLIVSVGGVFFLAAMFGLGIGWSLFMLLTAAIIQILIQPMTWLNWASVLIDWLVLAIINGWSMTQEVHLRHEQAINFGVITGVSQLFASLFLLVVQAMALTTDGHALTVIARAALPGTLVMALLYMALVPLSVSLVRHFSEQLPPEDDSSSHGGSRVIDLSNHQKKHEDDK